MDVEIEHPIAGRIHAIGMPVKYSATPGKISRPAPLLGQHTRDVLGSIGIRDEEYERLAAEGVVVTAAATELDTPMASL